MWRWRCMSSQEKGRQASTGDGELDGKSRAEPLNEFHLRRTSLSSSRDQCGDIPGEHLFSYTEARTVRCICVGSSTHRHQARTPQTPDCGESEVILIQ